MQTRRSALGALTGLAAIGAWPSLGMAKTATSLRFVAAWTRAGQCSVGVLAASAQHRLRVVSSQRVPTRAHGVQALADGTLLAVAKRPGDWLMRWAAGRSDAAQWQWAEPGRAFNGHAIVSPDGQRIYTTETHLDIGQGLVGVRDARTLAKLGEWPTFGMDPHELVWDTSTSTPAQPNLIVANGGIPTQPETGRAKLHLQAMDSSIVRLDARSGELLGQWRLSDQRLSLRHLAWQVAASDAGRSPVLGIALQAEHDSSEQKQSAPVLALFDGSALRTAPAVGTTHGYGGDIAALPNGWAVSCPHVHSVAVFDAAGQWREWLPLPHACALATTALGCWAAGRSDGLLIAAQPAFSTALPPQAYGIQPGDLQLDNHWSPMRM